MKDFILIALVAVVVVVASLFFVLKKDDGLKGAKQTTEIKNQTFVLEKTEVNEPRKHSSIQKEIFKYFQTGNYKKSFELMMGYFEADIPVNDRKWLESQDVAITVSYAYTLIHQKKCSEATDILHAAADRLGKLSLDMEKAIGICAFYEKDFYLAEAYLSNYLAKKNDDYEAMVSFSEILESLGRFDEAYDLVSEFLNEYGKGMDLDKREGLKTKKRLLKERSKESQLQESFRVRHFKLFYRSGMSEDLALSVLEELEQTLSELMARWGFREPKAVIEVILYPESQFKRLSGHGPDWASGIFDGRIRISYKDESLVKNMESLKKIIRHELIHALLHEMSGFRKIPSWLGEGMAQLFECLGDSCELVYPSKKLALDLNVLLQKDFFNLSALEAKEMYIQSLFLFASIKNEFNGDLKLKKMIESINKSSDLSFSSAIQSMRLNEKEMIRTLMANWADAKPLNYGM